MGTTFYHLFNIERRNIITTKQYNEFNNLYKQLEAYENMRKELNIFIKKKQKLGALNYVDINDLLNILNKVGDKKC